MRFLRLIAGLLFLSSQAFAADAPSADDVARYLAGLPVAPSSSLSAATYEPGWRAHANAFDAAFGRVDKARLSKIQRWSQTNLTIHRPTLFYMFSGPDFLYANAFFPDQTTYVLSGLEPVGAEPDLTKVPHGALPGVLRNIERSLRTSLNVSFFKTADMKTELRASPINGTLPVLYVFLARAGKIIRDVSLLHLADNGDVVLDAKPDPRAAAQGAKITFASPGGPTQTLYYFSTNVANSGFRKSGFQAFCERLGEGLSFVKSASYLLHGGDFSDMRTFLLQHSAAILQDDTGVPSRFFDASWQLRPFGRYLGPISLFAGRYQPQLAGVFRQNVASPIDFGVGYRWRPNESNLVYATRRGAPAEAPKPVEAKPAATPTAPPAEPKSPVAESPKAATPPAAAASPTAAPKTDGVPDATVPAAPAPAPATPGTEPKAEGPPPAAAVSPVPSSADPKAPSSNPGQPRVETPSSPASSGPVGEPKGDKP